MPIYEFYCADCHAIYSFFSRTVNADKRPACPKCGRPKLERQVSRFAISKGRAEPSAKEDGMPDIDESGMESMFQAMEQEADGIDEDDPRQMGRMMRKLMESSGVPMTEAMQEAIRRMEAGEDPDKIEEELGDQLDLDAPEAAQSAASLTRRCRPPRVDETLYDM